MRQFFIFLAIGGVKIMPKFYNNNDPRLRNVRKARRCWDALNLEGGDDNSRLRLINNAYYLGHVNRVGQSNINVYNTEVANAIEQNLPVDWNISIQNGHAVGAGHVLEGMISMNGYGFLHVDGGAPSIGRLYIPCRLDYVDVIIAHILQNKSNTGVVGFKVAAYNDAMYRLEVLVVWTITVGNAREYGAHIDQTQAALFGGPPIGVYPCSAANLCGWAIERPHRSVGMDVRGDLHLGGDRLARRHSVV
ncbi:MAG: hypothetical protein GY749_14370 [Desulfobacteraceae bacterium]|nr:hypothetical protein [Desulfobacteraceae bacterium]